MAVANNKMGVGTFQVDENEQSSDILDIFKPPVIEPHIIGGRTIDYSPINGINDNGPYTFVIQSSDIDYVHLPYTRLRGKAKIVKIVDGKETPCTSSDDYSVVNCFGNSLFKQVECSLNNVELADQSTATSHYKALIETVLSFSKDAKTTHLKTRIFHKDGVGVENRNETVGSDTTSGYAVRRSMVKDSKDIFFSTNLHVDFMNGMRLLPPNLNLKLNFVRGSDDFAIIAKTGTYKIKIEELKLSVRKVQVSEKKLNEHLQMWRSNLALFPYKRIKITANTIVSSKVYTYT